MDSFVCLKSGRLELWLDYGICLSPPVTPCELRRVSWLCCLPFPAGEWAIHSDLSRVRGSRSVTVPKVDRNISRFWAYVTDESQ